MEDDINFVKVEYCTDIEFDGFLKKLIFHECFAAFCNFVCQFLAAMLAWEKILNFKWASDFLRKTKKCARI